VRLESYEEFASVDLLADRMVASLLAGLSGRRYEQTHEPVGDEVALRATGKSQSSVMIRAAMQAGFIEEGRLRGARWVGEGSLTSSRSGGGSRHHSRRSHRGLRLFG
jgi:hypothetical protein